MHPARRFFGSGTRLGTTLTVFATLLVMTISLAVHIFKGDSVAETVSSTVFVGCVAAIAFLMSSMYFVHSTQAWVVKFVGCVVPSCMPVKMMDYEGSDYYSIAWEKDGQWIAPVYYGTDVGAVTMNPNGSCGGEGSSYMHIWQPLRQSDRVLFCLENIDHPSFDDWIARSRHSRYEWVEQKRRESK